MTSFLKMENKIPQHFPGGEMLSNVLLYFPHSSKFCNNKQKLFRMYTSWKQRYPASQLLT